MNISYVQLLEISKDQRHQHQRLRWLLVHKPGIMIVNGASLVEHIRWGIYSINMRNAVM